MVRKTFCIFSSQSSIVSFITYRSEINFQLISVDYAKAFDCVDHNKLWKILKEMRIPDHLTCLLRNLYAGQEATVRTGHGTTDWFQIGKGVRQGCILSPCLFTGDLNRTKRLRKNKCTISAWAHIFSTLWHRHSWFLGFGLWNTAPAAQEMLQKSLQGLITDSNWTAHLENISRTVFS